MVRPHLDYDDIICEKAYTSSLHQRIESVRYKALLGLESPQPRCWFRKLCYFYKLYKYGSPQYVFKLVPLWQSPDTIGNTENILLFKAKHNFYNFFSSAVIEWNDLDHKTWNVGRFSAFENNILKFFRPTPNNAFNY